MKKTKIVRYLKGVFPILSVVVMALLLPIAARYFSSAVCYSVSNEEGEPFVQRDSSIGDENVVCPFKKVSEIPLRDGYIVKSVDGSIAVFDKQMTPLYRIDAIIEELPEKDRRDVSFGIEIPDKSTLCEFVAHMES